MRILLVHVTGGWYIHQSFYWGNGVYHNLPPVFVSERAGAIRVLENTR